MGLCVRADESNDCGVETLSAHQQIVAANAVTMKVLRAHKSALLILTAVLVVCCCEQTTSVKLLLLL
jgi:hypothetical protein